MFEKVKTLLLRLNKVGLPLPMVRDPKSGASSVSLTMLFISFNLVLIGLIGKWSKYFDVDVTQALYFFSVNAALYFGRSFDKIGNNIEKKE